MPLPPSGLAFSVEVHAQAAAGEPTSAELREQWVECDVAAQATGPPAPSPQLVPLKSVNAPELSMQLSECPAGRRTVAGLKITSFCQDDSSMAQPLGASVAKFQKSESLARLARLTFFPRFAIFGRLW